METEYSYDSWGLLKKTNCPKGKTGMTLKNGFGEDVKTEDGIIWVGSKKCKECCEFLGDNHNCVFCK